MADVRPVWADRIRTERIKRGWDKAEMRRRLAQAAGDARGGLPDPECLRVYVQRWERGKVGISERYRLLYAAAFGMDEAELFGDVEGSVVGTTVPTHAEDDEMERRLLLRLAALGALGSSGPLNTTLVDLALTAEPRDLEDWHLACADHLYALRTRPPGQVRDDLIVDLLALGRQLKTAGALQQAVELRRVEAALATLHANVLTRLGDHGSAIRWWRTANAAADASGDLELRLVVRGAEAGFGLYGQRDLATVLHLTSKAQKMAGGTSSVGRAVVDCTQVKVLSLLGRHHEARQRVRSLVAVAPGDSCQGPIPADWTGDQVRFAESWVYAHAGDEAAADEVRDRMLAYPFLGYQYAANVRLHEALCTVVNGGIDTGARQAAVILAELPPSQHSHMITETGRTVLRAVPVDRRDRPAVRDLRALISGEALP